jgi:hypothetical protein
MLMSPVSAGEATAQAEIRNNTVPPACTLVAEAVMAMEGFAGAVGVVEGVGVGVAELLPPELDVEGVGVADGDAGSSGAGDPVTVLDGEGLAAEGELDALGELVVSVADAEAEAELEAAVLAELDGDAVAIGMAASAVPDMPLEMTKRPVARPTVTGRECADRMRTPCLLLLSWLENVLFRMSCHYGRTSCLLVTNAPI